MPFNYAVKVLRGREEDAAEELRQRAEALNEGKVAQIYSIMSIPSLRGYLVIEASNSAAIDRLIEKSRFIKGRLKGLVKDDELQKMLIPAPAIDQVKEGYIVEVTGGLLKGMKGKVEFINKTKGEIGISLMGTPNVMPIVVSADSVKVISTQESKQESGAQNA